MMSREELHELVWSQPMRTLAKARGVSDVALAKQCRKANVPVPPRGWWARKEAGKQVAVIPLPPQPFAMGRLFPAIETSGSDGSDSANSSGSPAPPTFRDLITVRREIEAAVSSLRVPDTLANPHPVVARLLKQDAGRQPKRYPSGYVSDFYGPKFATPIQQRRLRVLSSILTEMERLGCKVSGSTHAGERFSINVGGHWTYILFGVEGGTNGTYFHRDRSRQGREDGERLRFDITDHDPGRSPPAQTWRDDKTPIERKARDIVCGILVHVEDEARKSALWRHKWDIEQRAREEREAKVAAAKAEADRIAREKAAAAARIERLIDGAERLERAERIRRYVVSVQAANANLPTPASPEAIAAWMKWALAQADAIDPVSSGTFLADISRWSDGSQVGE